MASKPKLLLLVTSSAWGGAERYVARLASAARTDFDVTVAAGPSQGLELFKALPDGIKTVVIAPLTRPISPWQDLKAVAEVRELIDREGFDLVHANSSKAGLVASLAVWRSKRRPKLVFTAHGWGFTEKRSVPFRATLLASEKIAACRRDATIVLTGIEREIALAHRLSAPERLRIIPLGIDADEIAFLPREEAREGLTKICGRRLGRLTIGTVANAYPAKNLPALLEAFKRLSDEFVDLDLVILGGGPDLPDLLRRRDRLPHPDRACLPGAVTDAARFLKAFDLFVLPSTKEGLPWAILEASLAGVPIVATRVGALPELIEDRATGLLVPPGDVPALAAAIRAVLTNPGLLQKLRSGAPRIAERRSGSAMIADTLDLYRSLIRRS